MSCNICVGKEALHGFSSCHCSVCHETFTSLSGFEMHKPGRCLSPQKITEKGYQKNRNGYWAHLPKIDGSPSYLRK